MKAAPVAKTMGTTPIAVPQTITCALRRTWASAEKTVLEISDTKPSVVAARKKLRNTNPELGQP
jgi:hypothetical protein